MTAAQQKVSTLRDVAPLPNGEDFTWESSDGLLLSGCEWRPAPSNPNAHPDRIPLLCLPGLSRNTRDFKDIAQFLQANGHRILALDYRGRGKSAWDKNWHNYALPVEENDIAAALDALELDRFAVLGTSRGGLHALAMSNRYGHERMAAVIFNDIGPHIEMQGIRRIATTLGHKMKSASFEELAHSLEHMLGRQFPVFCQKSWLKLAHQLASERKGEVVLDYDPALACQLASVDDATPLPDLWPLYQNLTDRPVLVLRGEHSDLLSPETVRQMAADHPNAEVRTIPGQGHAPALWDRDTHQAVSDFLERL